MSDATKRMERLTAGTRIFSRGGGSGTLKCPPHFGTISVVSNFGNTTPGFWYTITPDVAYDMQPYDVPVKVFSPIYLDNKWTPFVTEAAYAEWYDQQPTHGRKALEQSETMKVERSVDVNYLAEAEGNYYDALKASEAAEVCCNEARTKADEIAVIYIKLLKAAAKR